MRAYYYPTFLDLRGRACVIVGGGDVAYGKVIGLLPCGAEVQVISPEVHPGIARLAARGTIRWTRRTYHPGDLAGAGLAIAATDDTALNTAVHAEAVRERVLVNVVDVPEQCQFVAGAVFRRGRLQVSISTGGASPALAARLKRELNAVFGPEHGQLVSAYRRLRPLVMERIAGVQARKRFWLELVAREDLLPLLRQRRRAELDAALRSAVEGFARREAAAGAVAARP